MIPTRRAPTSVEANSQFDTRLAGRSPAGDTKRQPLLDSLAGKKFEIKRPPSLGEARPPGKLDGKVASATSGECESKADLDSGPEVIHRKKPGEMATLTARAIAQEPASVRDRMTGGLEPAAAAREQVGARAANG